MNNLIPLAHTQEKWFRKVCDSYTAPPVFHNGVKLPAFPDDQLQINTTGAAGENTLREAFDFYKDCISTLNRLRVKLNAGDKILDFGSGWGRIARFFLLNVPKENIYGLDVKKEFVEVCRDTFESNNFSQCEAFPPTESPSNTFSLVTGYSVFSHLSEAACKSWMDEFHRIMAPGGVLALTTRGRPFFDYCKSLQGQNIEGYPAALATMFENFDDAIARYEAGEFVHSNVRGVDGGFETDTSFYGETFIPESYAREAYADKFVLEHFLFDPEKHMHPIMFFRCR